MIRQHSGSLLLLFAMIVGGILITPSFVDAQSAYSAGTYGSCQYNTCGITLGADASIPLNVTPIAGSTTCTTAAAQVQVTTDSSTGYTLTMTDNDTTTSLGNGTGATIAASSATPAAPTALGANTWGYRVDSTAGFGAGPTSAASNSAVPTATFAGVPLSSGTAAILATSTGPANPAVSTDVWYGLCADGSLQSGAYTDSVIYTAVVN